MRPRERYYTKPIEDIRDVAGFANGLPPDERIVSVYPVRMLDWSGGSSARLEALIERCGVGDDLNDDDDDVQGSPAGPQGLGRTH